MVYLEEDKMKNENKMKNKYSLHEELTGPNAHKSTLCEVRHCMIGLRLALTVV